MTQQEKIKRAEELFEELKKLFPNNVQVSIHGIGENEFSNLSEEWEVRHEVIEESNDTYTVAERNSDIGYSKITLFS